ncbi:MAG: glutathione peroxidase [Flavobacteriales bacterium]|nr:glutathione peroxidase [Flavobacteriales bacterium]MBL4735792.1 glutathione peroxidase [Flavobacteriales bacterium]
MNILSLSGVTKLLLMLLITNMAIAQDQKTLHDFTTMSLEGEEVKLSDFKGKKLMVVNTASKCGLTPQYKDLQALYTKYGDDKFAIIGFPANNFGKQEPGTDAEIKEFCTKNYGVSFPMMHKISVKGSDIDPIYAWLTDKDQNGADNAAVKWNFQKFLIDENGNWVGMVSPSDKPDKQSIIDWIETGKADF